MDAPTITLGRFPVTLAKPGLLVSLAITDQDEAVKAGNGPLMVACGAAAMALCWPRGSAWLVALPPPPWSPGMRIDAYGQTVFNALSEAGTIDDNALLSACIEAWKWAREGRITEAAVEAARDFSEPPPGA